MVTGPIQAIAVTAPPPRILTANGWVTLTPLGIWSNARSNFEALPIEAFTEGLVTAEKNNPVGRVEASVTVTVPVGTAVGAVKTGDIEVPSGEVWYLYDHEITIPETAGLSAGDITVNFKVSTFGGVNYYDPDDTDNYLVTAGAKVTGGGLTAGQAEIAAGDVTDNKLVTLGAVYDSDTTTVIDVVRPFRRNFTDGNELGTALRLFGGDKLTLTATVATATVAGADVEVSLRVWGCKGKRLVA